MIRRRIVLSTVTFERIAVSVLGGVGLKAMVLMHCVFTSTRSYQLNRHEQKGFNTGVCVGMCMNVLSAGITRQPTPVISTTHQLIPGGGEGDGPDG